MNGLPSQFHLITSAIDFARENHKVISQNIANVNTPEYKARTISFDDYLVNSKSEPAEMKLEYVEGLPTRNDGNNVDMDRELANLRRNELAHQTLTQLLGTQISILHRAITG